MFYRTTVFSSLSYSALCALLASMPLVADANSDDSWLGVGSEDPLIRLAVAPVEIEIEAPTPLTGNNLELLLALSGGGGLGEIREKAAREFSLYLDQQVQRRFGDFFEDERVHLVDNRAPLTLHTNFDIAIRQQIVDIRSTRDYDLEKGTMTAYGKFRYRVQGAAALREGEVDIADFKLRARYSTRAPKDGGVVEDTTRQATERLLEEIAEEVLDRIEDELEADALLALARR
ncbi:hypothetical protein JF535_05350 [Microbulbifer salipaludis]|uniref:Lipoprotein n=1 Tax=Microbulbifer salipaludis TaxID=187980 RepID=A0ABS3E4Q5_9GAMM|nr:hypothetical protein [Microbulbifer salipaludis]MBN8430278.1 hypothetical protein [Microbulbifer salipaludis]